MPNDPETDLSEIFYQRLRVLIEKQNDNTVAVEIILNAGVFGYNTGLTNMGVRPTVEAAMTLHFLPMLKRMAQEQGISQRDLYIAIEEMREFAEGDGVRIKKIPLSGRARHDGNDMKIQIVHIRETKPGETQKDIETMQRLLDQ